MSAIETAKNTENFLDRGLNKAQAGDFKAAVLEFSQAIQINPNNAQAYHNRGMARFKLGEIARAIEDFTQALRLNPNYTEAYVERGNAYRQLQDYQRAIIDYSQTVQLDTKDAKAYYNRGVAYSELGDKQKAIEDYQTALQLFYAQKDDINGRLTWENLDRLQRSMSAKSQENTTKPFNFSSKPSFSQQKNKHFDKGDLVMELMKLLHQDCDLAWRLISQVKTKNPGRSIDWCVEKVIFDLERDRSR